MSGQAPSVSRSDRRPARPRGRTCSHSVTVRNSAGTLVAAGSPTAPSGWTVAVNPDRAGREVHHRGRSDRRGSTPSDGFSTYGSLGAYELVVAGAAGGVPPPPPASTFTADHARLGSIDTRNGIGGYRRVGAGRQVVIQVTNGVTVPNGATAAVFSIAAVQSVGTGLPHRVSVLERSCRTRRR